MEVVKTWEEWLALPIRPFDDYLSSPTRIVRLPSVVICSNYDKISYKKAIFPTKSNIWERDNYTCQYSGKKLSRSELTIDHVVPRSKGGEDSWENLVTCKKEINHHKGDKLLGEAKYKGERLKLIQKPKKPKFGYDSLILDNFREEWQHFVTQ